MIHKCFFEHCLFIIMLICINFLCKYMVELNSKMDIDITCLSQEIPTVKNIV